MLESHPIDGCGILGVVGAGHDNNPDSGRNTLCDIAFLSSRMKTAFSSGRFLRFRVVFHKGKPRSEVLDNIKEAIAGYLESLQAHGEPVPPSITEEVVEVTL